MSTQMVRAWCEERQGHRFNPHKKKSISMTTWSNGQGVSQDCGFESFRWKQVVHNAIRTYRQVWLTLECMFLVLIQSYRKHFALHKQMENVDINSTTIQANFSPQKLTLKLVTPDLTSKMDPLFFVLFLINSGTNFSKQILNSRPVSSDGSSAVLITLRVQPPHWSAIEM